MTTATHTTTPIRRVYRWDEIPVPRTIAEAEAAIKLVESCVDSCEWELSQIPPDHAARASRIKSAQSSWRRVLVMLKYSLETLLADNTPDSARVGLLEREIEAEKVKRANAAKELWRQLLMFETFILHGGDREAFLRKAREEVPEDFRDAFVAERRRLGLSAPRSTGELPPRGGAK